MCPRELMDVDVVCNLQYVPGEFGRGRSSAGGCVRPVGDDGLLPEPMDARRIALSASILRGNAFSRRLRPQSHRSQSRKVTTSTDLI